MFKEYMCWDSSKTNKQQQQQQQQKKHTQLYTFYCKLNVSFVTSVYMYMYMGWYSRVIYCSSSSVSDLYTHQHLTL